MKEKTFAQRAPKLRRAALKASRNAGATEDEAEDIAQDAMLRFWQMHNELDRFRSLEAVAGKMARNLTLNMHRKKKFKMLDDSAMNAVSLTAVSPSTEIESSEELRWLENKMKSLPTTEYAILQMRQVEHQNNREIAQRLGIEESSVSTLMARARRRLLEEIRRRNGK